MVRAVGGASHDERVVTVFSFERLANRSNVSRRCGRGGSRLEVFKTSPPGRSKETVTHEIDDEIAGAAGIARK